MPADVGITIVKLLAVFAMATPLLGLGFMRFQRWCLGLDGAVDRWCFLLYGVPILLGALSYLLALLGVLHLFEPGFVCFAAWFMCLIVAVPMVVWGLRRGWSWEGADVLSLVGGVIILAFAALTLTGALAPPTSNEWDALAYHLALPKLWLADGFVHHITYDSHSGFPMTVEMLYAVGLSVKSVAAAKLFHWLYGMLCALACYWAGRHWVSRRAGLLAAALFLAVPVVAWEATTAYIDLAATLYTSLAVFAFLRWLEAAGTPHPLAPSLWPSPPSPLSHAVGEEGLAAKPPPAPPSKGGGPDVHGNGLRRERPVPLPPGGARGGQGGRREDRGERREVPTRALSPLSSSLYPSDVAPSQPPPEGGGPELGQPATPSPQPPSNGWLILAGICGGLACGVKMTLIASSGLVILWGAGLAARRARGVTWKHAGILAALMLVIGAPWYIKTWVWTGNPFYPFAYGLFGGKWWGAKQAADYAAEQARFGIGKTAWGLAMAPWTTAFHAQYYANPPDVFNGTLSNAPAQNAFPAVFGGLGLGVVGLLPLWLLSARRNPGTRAMVLYSGAFFLVWFALSHQTRYLMPILPVLLVPAVAGARDFWHRGPLWKGGVGAFAGLALLAGLLPLYILVQPAMAVAWGAETPDAYLSRVEPIYGVSKQMNSALPADAEVLFLQETRGFYLDRKYQWGNPSQNTLIPWDTLTSPEAMDAVLKAQGITHALVNWSATAPETAAEHWPGLVDAAVAKELWKPVIATSPTPHRGFTVYSIK